mgnify:CR=1 FL=1
MTGHRRDPLSNARRAIEGAVRALPGNLKLWRMVGEMAVKGAEQRFRARSGTATAAMHDLGVPTSEPRPSAPRPVHEAADAAVAQEAVNRALASGLPIAGYDDLSASQVRERLGSLDAAARATVAAYERAHRGRSTILEAIARLDGATPG